MSSTHWFSNALKAFAVTLIAFTAQSATAADLPLGPEPVQGPIGSPPGFYVSLKAGANILDDISAGGLTADFDTGYALLGAIGYDTGDIWHLGKVRIEGEIGYRENDFDDIGGVSVGGDVEQLSFMANVYHDFLPGSRIRPYIGAGLGAVDVDVTASLGGFAASASDTEFVYQLMAGLTFEATQNIAIDAEYRYTEVDTSPNVENHAILIGTRFKF